MLFCTRRLELKKTHSWLVAHGRTDEATEVLACLENKSIDDPFIITQRKEIEYTLEYEREHAVKWREIIRPQIGSTKTLRRLLLGAGTQAMQQFGGINIMSYYLPTVLIESVGLSNRMARLLSACNAVSYLVFSCLAIPLIERWGRRALMLISTFGQFLSFLVITILLRFAEGEDGSTTAAKASIAFFFSFITSRSVSVCWESHGFTQQRSTPCL